MGTKQRTIRITLDAEGIAAIASFPWDLTTELIMKTIARLVNEQTEGAMTVEIRK